MSLVPFPRRLLLVAMTVMALLLASGAAAQNCLPEQEPNDTPATANQLPESLCVAGELSGSDQDAFQWTISEEDARRPWRIELESVRGQLTSLQVFRVEFADNGTDVTGFKDLLEVSTADGRMVTSEPRLFAAGTYHLGLALSGGEGRYSLAVLPGDVIRDFRQLRSPDDGAWEVENEFSFAGELESSLQVDWTVSEEAAVNLWRIDLIAAVGEELSLKLLGLDGAELLELASGDAGLASVSSLGLEPGTYRMQVTSSGERIAPFRLLATTQGIPTDGQEIEPNSDWRSANVLVPGQELSGTISAGGDVDQFRFQIDQDASALMFNLETGTDEFLDVCLQLAGGSNFQCRSGSSVRLPDLALAAGEYGLWLRNRDTQSDIPYTLLLDPVGELPTGFATEPNDDRTWASTIPSDLMIRGQLYGEEPDYLRLEVSGEPQLWRVHVLGSGVRELHHLLPAGGADQSAEGESRLQLDNLLLLPGTHYFLVEGRDSDYALRLFPLGPPDALKTTESSVPTNETTAEPAAEPAGPADADVTAVTLHVDEPAAVARPAGNIEQEPNNVAGQATRLEFGVPSVGLLPSRVDRDFYTFHLAAGQHVRLQVTQPAEARFRMSLDWGNSNILSREFGVGETVVGTEWLPAGDYTLSLWTDWPGDEYYQILLERLDPFTVAPGREANYPEWFGRESEADGPVVADIPGLQDLDLELRPSGPGPAAAFWPRGQELELELTATNVGADTLDLQLDWHSTDAGWRPELPDSVNLAGGEQLSLAVPVFLEPDIRDDSVVLTVHARGQDGLQTTTSLTLLADSMAEPVGSHLSWPVPPELLGGLNAAWLDLGAALVYAGEEEREVAERFELAALFDGMTPMYHDYYNYRMWDRVPRQYEMEELLPTVQLAGTEPVEVAGFLLHPQTTNELASSLHEFAVYLSLDGEEFTRVLDGALSPRQVEQAFVLPEPVTARYARLEMLNNHVPGSTPQENDIRLGTFKVVTTRDSAAIISGEAGLNIADAELGGHLVWSDPPGIAHSSSMLRRDDDRYPTARLDFEQEDSVWVVGFHHNRAAQITGFRWLDHPDTVGGLRQLQQVEVSVSTAGPGGPWTELGTWELQQADVEAEPFNLADPVWARFVRFRATSLVPRDTYNFADQLQILERIPDDSYGSILGEWGHYSAFGIFEYLNDESRTPAETATGNLSQETAAPLPPGNRVQGNVELGVDEAWYVITVPQGQNHLTLTLQGEPNRGFDHELLDGNGDAVQAEEQISTPTELVLTASVVPGDYWLRIFEPPRSVVISWDTSGSVSQALPVIYQALARFAMDISPGVEEVNLLPFGRSFLLRNWSGEPLRVLQAINDDPRSSDSSSGEDALLMATQALANRPGKKAVILLTDAAIVRNGALWNELLKVRPQVFASSITSTGALSSNAPYEQDLMQDYASVNGGHYEYVQAQSDFDVTFRRAAAWLRRPSHYVVQVELDQRWANASAWAEPELERALELDLIPAVLLNADLTGSITRAEFAAVAVRVYESLTGTPAVPAAENPFTDTNDPEVLKAFNTELAVGISQTEFAPDQLLNREQAATILTRVYKRVHLPGWTWAGDADFTLDFNQPEPFVDDTLISPWARESVYFMASQGIITGTGNNMFQPRAASEAEAALGAANATREQALLLAVRLVEKGAAESESPANTTPGM